MTGINSSGFSGSNGLCVDPGLWMEAVFLVVRPDALGLLVRFYRELFLLNCLIDTLLDGDRDTWSNDRLSRFLIRSN